MPTAKFSDLEPIGRPLGELRHHLRVMQHRPGDQVRKVRDEQRIRDETWLRRLALVGVDEKGDLGEGEKGDAERQDDAGERNVDAAELPQRIDEKIGVLEIAESREIGDDRGRQHLLRGAGTPQMAQPADRSCRNGN